MQEGLTLMANKRYALSKDVVELVVGTRNAVYHRQRGGLCMLDDAAYKVLQGFRSGRVLQTSWIEDEAPNREAELVQQLLARGFLVTDDAQQQAVPTEVEKKVNIIQLILANACNFGCTYCFEGIQGKEMSVEAEV